MCSIQDILFSPTAQSTMPVIMGSCVRLVRNLRDYKFPQSADEVELRKISELCKSILMGCRSLKSPKIFEINKLNPVEKLALVESNLCSQMLIKTGFERYLLVSNENSISISINEIDHLRMQIFGADLDFRHLWGKISEIDDYIISAANVAYDDTYGFLSACPMDVGTGLHASVIMHLPGLVLNGQITSMINAVQRLGFIVQGIYSDVGNAGAGIFRVSNQHTLGLSEPDILLRLGQSVLSIAENEELARRWLVKNRYANLRDAIGRSFGALSNSYSMNVDESTVHLSNMRLAVDLGYLPPEKRAIIDPLIVNTQPAHVKANLGLSATDLDCSMKRADVLRHFFNSNSELKF